MLVLKKIYSVNILALEEPWLQMYTGQGTACPLDGRPQREVQVGPDKLEVVASFCYLGDMQQVAVNFKPQHVWKLPGRSSRSCYQFSLHATSLSRHVAMCTAFVCGVQYSMPVRLSHWQNQISNICSGMTGQWSDSSAMSGRNTLSPPGPMNYLRCLVLRIWTSFWRREGSAGMDLWNTPIVQLRQPFTYSLRESVGGPRWHGSSWQRGIAESGSSWLSTLMIEICGDLVWDLPCVQQASYLEGGPLMLGMLPLYLHVNQKSDYDYEDMINYISEKIRLGISCELSAWQTIHMKCQALFSLKIRKKNIVECHLLYNFTWRFIG